MEAIKAFIVFVTSSVIGLVFLIFALLSLPFNVIALMHKWHFEWWSALIIACFMNVIPLFGQVAYFVLAILGGYYFYEADFDWQRAAYRPVKTFDFSQMTEDQFNSYKDKNIRPVIEDACLREAERRFGFNGKVPVSTAALCKCYATTALSYMTRENIASAGPNISSEITNAVSRNCSSP